MLDKKDAILVASRLSSKGKCYQHFPSLFSVGYDIFIFFGFDHFESMYNTLFEMR